VLLFLWLAPLSAEQWQLRYFYDEKDSTLSIADLQFPFARRGVAVGMIDNGKKPRSVSVVTSDGGAHWEILPLQEQPLSLFFANEDAGWMVTARHPWENRIWRTADGGLTWRPLPEVPPQIIRVYFTDPKHGWAIGSRRTVLETDDAGQTWKPAAGTTPNQYFSYDVAFEWMAFANPQFGLITGWERLPRNVQPAWLDPESSVAPPQKHLSYELTSRDAGKTWQTSLHNATSHVSRVRFASDGRRLDLIDNGGSLYPCELAETDPHTGTRKTIYRSERLVIQDFWPSEDGAIYVAGVRPAGLLRSVVPGKVLIFRSVDRATWKEMPVDYRAVATRAMFASSGGPNLWLATDTGMLLTLAP
jgi:photosystem II stability/assembly factor-like uncharacterized protein